MSFWDNRHACDVFGIVYLMVVGGIFALFVDRLIAEIREWRRNGK